MAQLDPKLAREMCVSEDATKPDLWDTVLLAKQFWEKAEKAAPKTTVWEKTLRLFCQATLVLHGNLEFAIEQNRKLEERIAALEAKQKTMASTVTRLVMDAADE